MPVKRRLAKGRRARLSVVEHAVLHDLQPPSGEGINKFDAFVLRSPGFTRLEDLWREHGVAITAAWARTHPGTRPSCWWRWTAPRQPVGTWPGAYYDGKLPQPRRRLGGIGTPAHEVLGYWPDLAFGIWARWITEQDVRIFDGMGGRPFMGVPIDPRDPPSFEAQAAYVERHGLLLPGERKLLKAADFMPELVLPEATAP